MKVVYKKSIIDKMIDAIIEARLYGKEIEKIVLTETEAYDFQKTLPFATCSTTFGTSTFSGVPIEVEGKSSKTEVSYVCSIREAWRCNAAR